MASCGGKRRFTDSFTDSGPSDGLISLVLNELELEARVGIDRSRTNYEGKIARFHWGFKRFVSLFLTIFQPGLLAILLAILLTILDGGSLAPQGTVGPIPPRSGLDRPGGMIAFFVGRKPRQTLVWSHDRGLPGVKYFTIQRDVPLEAGKAV